MEQSYGFPSKYFQNKHILIAHLRDLYYKGLDPTYYPRLFITPLYLEKLESSHVASNFRALQHLFCLESKKKMSNDKNENVLFVTGLTVLLWCLSVTAV